MAIARDETRAATHLQYVTTDDGYRIAYSASGEGPAFLMTPCLLQGDILRDVEATQRFTADLEERHQLIRYDGRGTGQSTRGVSKHTTLDDTVTDLVTVVDHLGLDRFVLYGDVFSSYTVLRAACLLREAVLAVVLVNPAPLDGRPFMPEWEAMYSGSWELFTNTFVSVFGGQGRSGEDMREVVQQADFVRLARSARGYHLKDVLPRVYTPTLVLTARDPVNRGLLEAAQQIGSTVPGCRVVYFEGQRNADILWSPGGGTPPAIPVIEDFLASLPDPALGAPDIPGEHGRQRPQTARLSRRQREVLRLVGLGRTNHEIAQELVLSVRTVERHLGEAYAKLGVTNRVQAAQRAREHGIA